jgi:hypothetical protein
VAVAVAAESRVMETSMSAVRADVGGIYDRLLLRGRVDDDVPAKFTVVLHLGVAYNATGFRLERCAYNDATFRVPDEGGCMPDGECISLLRGGDDDDHDDHDDDGVESLAHDWGRCVETTLDLDGLCDELRTRPDGEEVTVSADPGRFVCNYAYYLSLNRCRSINDELRRAGKTDRRRDGTVRAHDATDRHHALFVHVPPFDAIPEGRQLAFIRRVMEVIERQLDKGTMNERMAT